MQEQPSSEYRPREHDQLVEPLFGGLQGVPAAAKERSPALCIFIALCAVALALRAWRLASG